ncbi:MAG: YraN family protein [Bacteroidetes bacterium]|nr:YraN family protein [Bacteroidota bacterium]
MTEKNKKGKDGEEEAASFLTSKGYSVVETNFRYQHCEIDLVVKKNGWLIFVEVKMRTGTAFGPPEIFVTRQQRRNIRWAARHYLFSKGWQGNVRFDVIAILRSDLNNEITHFEDAFH